MIRTSEILNFSDLPESIQEEIGSVNDLQFEAFHCVQSLKGYRDLKLVCCLSVTKRIPSGKYEAWSYGSDNFQWSYQSGMIPA